MRDPQIPTKVQFITEWMGNPPNSCKILWSNFAKELESRGTVKIIPSKPSLSVINDPLPEEEKKIEEKEIKKFIRKAPKDKMVRTSKDK